MKIDVICLFFLGGRGLGWWWWWWCWICFGDFVGNRKKCVAKNEVYDFWGGSCSENSSCFLMIFVFNSKAGKQFGWLQAALKQPCIQIAQTRGEHIKTRDGGWDGSFFVSKKSVQSIINLSRW